MMQLSKTPKWIPFLIILVAAFVADWIDLYFYVESQAHRLIAFPCGVALAVLLLFGVGTIPALALGSLISQWVQGHPWHVIPLLVIGPILGACCSYFLLKRAKFDLRLLQIHSVIKLLIPGVALCAGISALVEVIGWRLVFSEMDMSSFNLWYRFWLSSALGVLTLVPLLLTYRREPWPTLFPTSMGTIALWLILLNLINLWAFWSTGDRHLPVAFIPFPLLIWSALRFGAFPTMLGFLMTGISALLASRANLGPFGDLSPMAMIPVTGLFFLVHAGTGLLVSAVMATSRLSDLSLRESRALFRAISEQMPDALFLLDSGVTNPPGTIILANNAAARMRGCAVDDLIGKSIFKIFHSEKDELSGLAHLLEGSTVRTEGIQGREDGSSFPIDISSRLILYGGQRVILLLARDISKSKKAQEEVQQSKSQMDEAQAIANFGSWEWFPQTGRVVLSAHMAEMYQLPATRDSFSLSEIVAILHPEDHPIIEEGIERVLTTGEPGQAEYRLANSERTFISMGGQVERDENDEIVRVVGTVLDITEQKKQEAERKQLEARILQSQKLQSLGVLAGGIAHDFNNLLTIILGNAGLATLDLPPNSTAIECLTRIETATQRAADLCNQMLAYSGKGVFQIQRILINEHITEMGHLMDSVISPRATLRFNFGEKLPPIEGDVNQIRQILLNLITNASEAMGEEDGIITITTGTIEMDQSYLARTILDENLDEGLYVYFEVSDTGCGMDEETQARVFDPFFTTKFTGRGLGLAATLGIVRGHRGTIKIYSEPGQGSSFKILLPACEVEEFDLDERSQSSSAWTGGGLILIVEDDESIRSLASTALSSAGFDVIQAANGKEGLEQFRQRHEEISLVLLDVIMPQLSGEEAFREMRLISPGVRVLLTSGYNEQEATHRFSSTGLAGFIQKPYRPVELVASIIRILSEDQKSKPPD